MRWGINLRGDLAKLDDAEIASRYEVLVSDKEAWVRQLPKHPGTGLMHRLAKPIPWRGPLHARIFYKWQFVLMGVLAALQGGGSLPTNSGYERYMKECELLDVTDEIKRRVARKKLSQSRS
jgi:hypothetical protein